MNTQFTSIELRVFCAACEPEKENANSFRFPLNVSFGVIEITTVIAFVFVCGVRTSYVVNFKSVTAIWLNDIVKQKKTKIWNLFVHFVGGMNFFFFVS